MTDETKHPGTHFMSSELGGIRGGRTKHCVSAVSVGD